MNNELMFAALIFVTHVALATPIFAQTKPGIKSRIIVIVGIVLLRTLGFLEGLHANGGIL